MAFSEKNDDDEVDVEVEATDLAAFKTRYY